MKLRLNPNYLRSRNKERASSTQSVNCDTMIYHSPHAPTSNYQQLCNNRRLPGSRITFYLNGSESGYDSDGVRHEINRRTTPNEQTATGNKNGNKKQESDADSGVSSAGSHSETNSDSGSLTGNDSSFDHCSKSENGKSPTKSTTDNNVNKDKTADYCQCPSDKDNNSHLNLTDEEKLVPPLTEDSYGMLSEPANITSLRQQFLTSQLKRQKSNASSICSASVISTPSPIYSPIEDSAYSWWDKIPSDKIKSSGGGMRCLPDSRPPLSLPLSLAPQLSAAPRTYKMMRLTKDSSGELGIYITGKKEQNGVTAGYVIAHIEKDGLTDR